MSVVNYVLQGGLPDLWRRFFCPEDIHRHKRTSFVPENPTVDIMHGDLECRYTFPWLDGRTVAFWNFPWFRANSESSPAAYKALFTDLDEVDVTQGGKSLSKAEDSLRLAVQESNGEELIMLNSACVPDLTGEDPTPFLQTHGARAKVIYRASDGRDVAYSTTTEMIRLAKEGQSPQAAPDPRAVNLVGYPGGRARSELISLLTGSGVEVAACVVPSLAFAALRRARRASLQVVMSHRLFEGESRDFLAEFPTASLRPPAPYGVEGSRRWLGAVAEAAGLGQTSTKVWDARWSALAGRWKELTREAARHRLAFVLDPSQVAKLSDLDWTVGIPVLDVLKEMGFGIDYLIYNAKEAAPAKKGRPAARHRVLGFKSPAELEARLKDGDFQAVYSDYFFDHRLTRGGKAQFSLSFFEAGPEGAVRSLERLLGACRLPFYGRYSRYLSPRKEAAWVA